MVLIIWKPCRLQGTCKSRYKARRAERAAQRREDQQLARKIVKELTGSSTNVMKTLGKG